MLLEAMARVRMQGGLECRVLRGAEGCSRVQQGAAELLVLQVSCSLELETVAMLVGLALCSESEALRARLHGLVA